MDTIADFLTVVRNAGAAQHKTATVPYSKIKESIARILKDEGYILDYVVEGDKIKNLTLTLKYQNRKHVIQALRRISKPGIRLGQQFKSEMVCNCPYFNKFMRILRCCYDSHKNTPVFYL